MNNYLKLTKDSRASSYNFHIKLNILLLFIIFVNTPNIYNQTLTADKIYKKVSDAVVVILAYNSSNKLSSQGSGVVINNKGYVVTNFHVLAENDRLEILHNKEIVPYVDIIGIDVQKDILILKIEEEKLPSIKIGDSKNLTIGQRIYAIGSPMGFENSISEGIISGLRSSGEMGKNVIQITASISPGSSGGAVVNDKGELIGISTFTVSESQNLNFAIPIDDILGIEIKSYSQNKIYKKYEWYSKGIDEFTNGNYKEAIKYFTIFIKEYPFDEGAYNDRGIGKVRLGDYGGALQDFNKAIDLNPDLAVAYKNRGNLKLTLEDYKGAMQDFNNAISVNPNYAEAYLVRGVLKANLSDNLGALQDINKSIERNPNDSFAFTSRGLVKSFLKDYKGALQDFNKAITINPQNANAFLNRGLVKGRLGDKSGACLDYSKAGELGAMEAYDYISEDCN